MSNATRLQMSLSAKGLPNLSGFMQTSDPFAIVTALGNSPNNSPTIVGHTEVVYNNLNPTWSTVVILDGYKFGVPLYIEVGVFDFFAENSGLSERHLAKQSSTINRAISEDVSNQAANKKKFPHKIMGSALFEVGEVLGTLSNEASKKLQHGGEVVVHVESCKTKGNMGKIQLQLCGLDLENVEPKRSIRKKSSPFFELYRRFEKPAGGKEWNKVYKSNVVKGDLNPRWDPALLDLETLCNGDLDRAVKIVISAHRRSGKHKVMAEFKTTVQTLLDMKCQANNPDQFFSLKTSEKTITGVEMLENDATKGTIVVLQADIFGAQTPLEPVQEEMPQQVGFFIAERPEFVDYLTGGCKVGLAVAIDFSTSNGDPSDRSSLHYYSRKKSNDYQTALRTVGSCLSPYDWDQSFPVWGFGAGFDENLRHCFQCGKDAEVEGVDGILRAYKSVLKNPEFAMGEEAVFTKVIEKAAKYATFSLEEAEQEDRLAYSILLILTAGKVDDLEKTKEALDVASRTPLSVVIVGIGEKDFEAMEFLDGDFFDLDSNGVDITQFVKFNDFRGDTSTGGLTRELLDEVPDQLVDHFYERGILPGPPVRDAVVPVQVADDTNRASKFWGDE